MIFLDLSIRFLLHSKMSRREGSLAHLKILTSYCLLRSFQAGKFGGKSNQSQSSQIAFGVYQVVTFLCNNICVYY